MTEYMHLVNRVNAFVVDAWPDGKVEPNTRGFIALEEMLELNQVLGLTPEKAHELVDYVFSRPVGELNQEAGGVAFTTTALFSALGIDFIQAGHESVDEAYGRIDQIRAKSKTKPKVNK